MSVVITFENSLDQVTAEGDLVTLVNNLNVAQASGKQFALLDTPSGPEMVNTKLIVRAKEYEDDDASIGR